LIHLALPLPTMSGEIRRGGSLRQGYPQYSTAIHRDFGLPAKSAERVGSVSVLLLKFLSRRVPMQSHQGRQLPKRIPAGAVYVIEGLGGQSGRLRISSRYVVLPGGRRIELQPSPSRSIAGRNTSRRRLYRQRPDSVTEKKSGSVKKFMARAGTGRQRPRS
jgi:hypothetical protein